MNSDDPLRSAVTVQIFDVAEKVSFAAFEMPPENLPELFDASTTLHIADGGWKVVGARPMTRAPFSTSGRLTLVVRKTKIENVDRQTLLYSLPTITDVLPAISSGSAKLGRDIYEIEEDDWRQLEWISVTHLVEIEAVLRIAQENGLLLVNWVRAEAVQPSVVDYTRVLI